MAKRWERLKKLSSWRKISFGMWDAPNDPTIYGLETLDVTETLEYLREASEASGVKVSMTALIALATARVLSENPTLNVTIIGPYIYQRHSVDIFCQVAMPSRDPSAADLSGVKIEGADKLNVVEISEILSGRARKLRAGQDEEMERTKSQLRFISPRFIRRAIKLFDFLTFTVPIDLDGVGIRSDPFGSAMVTSVAQFDIKQGFAPLLPSAHCSLVLLPGCVQDLPMVVDGEVKARKAMTVSATFDHRAYDGLQIGHIVRAMRQYLTEPYAHWPEPASFARTPSAQPTATAARKPESTRPTR